MDSQDYLDQISAGVRPGKSNTGLMKIITSKYFKWGMIALAVLVVVIVFVSILNNKPSIKNKCYSLNFHLENDLQLIDDYQPFVKSSRLRSLSASLKQVFSNTSSQLSAYIEQVFGASDEKRQKEPDKELVSLEEEADMNRAELDEDLFAAKINGLLDRTYAHKMALEIYSVLNEEDTIINTAEDEDLKSLLSDNQDSLNNLYNEFNDFSEIK